MAHGYIKTVDLIALNVTTAKFAAGAVDTAALAANAVTVEKLAPQLPRTLTFLYRFAVQGGAQAALTLTDVDGVAQKIPANAVIQRVHAEVETAFTSGGLATVKFGFTGNDNAFRDTLNFDDARLLLDKFTSINSEIPIKVGGSAVSVLMTPATANLTAGVLYVYVEYIAGH